MNAWLTVLSTLFFTQVPLSFPTFPVCYHIIVLRYDLQLQNRFAVVAEPLTPGEIIHTVDAIVMITVIAQVNKFIATFLLAEPTT